MRRARHTLALRISLVASAIVGCADDVATTAPGELPEPPNSAPPGPSVTTTPPVEPAGSGGTVTGGSGGAPPPGEPRGPLVHHEFWEPVPADADPFDDRPAVVECLPSAVIAEELAGESALDVYTADCNYLTVTQPSLRAVGVGETLKVRLWHFRLSSPAPAQAHAAVSVGGLVLLDERIPIPSDAGLLSRATTVMAAIPEGAEILFHLHNHGDNSWGLVEISTGP